MVKLFKPILKDFPNFFYIKFPPDSGRCPQVAEGFTYRVEVFGRTSDLAYLVDAVDKEGLPYEVHAKCISNTKTLAEAYAYAKIIEDGGTLTCQGTVNTQQVIRRDYHSDPLWEIEQAQIF